MAGHEPRIEQSYRIPNVGGTTAAPNNIGTTNVLVLSSDPSRKRMWIHNPNSSVTIMVSQTTSIPTFASPAGGFLIFAGAWLEIEGEPAQSEWQAIAASGSSNGLSILVSKE